MKIFQWLIFQSFWLDTDKVFQNVKENVEEVSPIACVCPLWHWHCVHEWGYCQAILCGVHYRFIAPYTVTRPWRSNWTFSTLCLVSGVKLQNSIRLILLGDKTNFMSRPRWRSKQRKLRLVSLRSSLHFLNRSLIWMECNYEINMMILQIYIYSEPHLTLEEPKVEEVPGQAKPILPYSSMFILSSTNR